MKTFNILALIILTTLFGCRGNQDEATENETLVDTTQAVPEGYTGWEEDIYLDRDEPWKANIGTTEGIQRMSEILETRSATTVEEYRELGDALQEERNRLQEERESLDEENVDPTPMDENLDIYLEPLNEKIEQLQEVRSVEEGARLKSDLEKHLYAYSNYFV